MNFSCQGQCIFYDIVSPLISVVTETLAFKRSMSGSVFRPDQAL